MAFGTGPNHTHYDDQGRQYLTVQDAQQLVNSDPQIQQILKDYSAKHPGAWGSPVDTINQYLAAKGVQLPREWGVAKTTGELYAPTTTGWDAFFNYGVPLLAAGTGAAAVGGSLASGAGALGPTTAGSIAGTTAGAAAPASIAAGGGTVAGTTAAATAGTSLWKTLAAPVIGAGTNIAGSLINAHQQDKATEAELQKAREAQAFLEKKYEQTQNQVAPYIAGGQGGLAALMQGLGVRPQNQATLTTGQTRPVGQTTSGFIPDPQATFQQIQAQNPGAVIPGLQPRNQPTQTGSGVQMVKLQSPDGSETQSVPSSQAQYYISKGAKVVQ